jgi:hypothetical protein
MVRFGKYILSLEYTKNKSIVIYLDAPKIAYNMAELSKRPKPLSTIRFIINNLRNELNKAIELGQSKKNYME